MVQTDFSLEHLGLSTEGVYHLPNPIRAFIGAFKEHNIVVKKIIILFAFIQLASTKSSISADILEKCISTQNTLLQ